MLKSIRFRLAVTYAATLVLILILLAASLQFVIVRNLTTEIDDNIAARADKVAERLEQQRDAQFPSILQSLIDADPVDEYSVAPVFVKVLDLRGEVLIRSRNLQSERLAISDETLKRVNKGEAVLETLTLEQGESVRIYSRPLTFGGQIIGIVQVGKSLREVDAVAGNLRRILLVGGLLAVALAGAGGYLLAWRGLAAVDRVVKAAEEIEAQHLDRFLRLKDQPTEVQHLADTFDAMLERLHRSFEQQRQFTADVSHELRTPLTIIQGNLDVALLDERQDPALRNTLMRVRNEATRLTRLVTNLLLLARSDAGQTPDLRPVDLDIVLLEVLRQAQSLSQDVQIRLGKEDQITLLGDPDQLKQLILNLVDNALKFTPAGGRVTLSLERDGDFAKVTVSDTGVGIPEEDLPHIFDRYYRASKDSLARRGGVGLGLAIASQIAEAHGGRITVRSTVGVGSSFEVWLPLRRLPNSHSD